MSSSNYLKFLVFLGVTSLLILSAWYAYSFYFSCEPRCSSSDTGERPIKEGEVVIDDVDNLDNGTNLEITLTNVGNRTLDLDNFARLEYSVPGEARIESDYAHVYTGIKTNEEERTCLGNLTSSDNNLKVGESASCYAGINVQNLNQTLTIYLVDVMTSYEVDSADYSFN